MTVACGHTHEDVSPRAASLCDSLWNVRYKSVAMIDTLAAELMNEAGDNNELKMVASNALAYAAMMQMDYHKADSIYKHVGESSECEIERLVADVGLMTICYRVSENRKFSDYRAKALEKIRRINEEYELLSPADKQRFMRARIELSIVSVCYFSNLGMQKEKDVALEYLKKNLDKVDDKALRLYGEMFVINNTADSKVRLKGLCDALSVAEDNGYKWLEANYGLLLAISLRDSVTMDKFKEGLPYCYNALNANGYPDDEYAVNLAIDAVSAFEEYGDGYMMIEALTVLASCDTEYGRYDIALGTLDEALRNVNEYYRRYYPNDTALAKNYYNFFDSNSLLAKDGVYNIHECMLSVRREYAAALAGVGDTGNSNLNRDTYLKLLTETRQNKNLETRFSMAEEDASTLDYAIIVSSMLLLLAIVAAFVWRRRRIRHNRNYSSNLRLLQETCKNLLSSLPRDVDSKEELCGHISAFLNNNLGDFAGKTSFSLLASPITGEKDCLYEFVLHYVNGGEDTLYVVTERPLLKEKLSVLSTLVPYVAVAIEEGMRLSHISDERERAREELEAYSIYLGEHKRENLLKRVSVSVVIGMRPFMDRIIRELVALSEPMDAADEERKLKYIDELTGKLDDLNVILERWIKMRQGELNLQVENFKISDIFSIIEKSRMLLERKGVKLVVDDSNAVVKADKALTLFMLNTLVDNASKFTPQGGTITLSGIETDAYVELSVSDTGVGMSQSDIDRILGEKVYDASSIGSDNELLPAKSKGGGFGLMNCKGIIDKYRKTDAMFSVCSMNIESTKGKGSRFSFRLPKGVMRLVLLVMTLLPFSAEASVDNDCLDKVGRYADSIYYSNVDGNYEQSLLYGKKALECMNRYYREKSGGNDTLSLASGAPNELKWWREGVFPEELYEQTYYNILDIRNEIAVAFLALHEWKAYRYNNHVYSTLYRYTYEDKDIEKRYDEMRANIKYRSVALAVIVLLLVMTLLYIVVSYLNHSIIGKKNERMALDVNNALLNATSVKERLQAAELLTRFADTLFARIGEGFRMNSVSIMLCKGENDKDVVVTSGDGSMLYRSNVLLAGVVNSGEPYVSPDGLVRVVPLSVASADGPLMVGAMEVDCMRPLANDEVTNLELISDYVASVIYHTVVRVANSYSALEEVEDAAERMKFEENRLHVQNMVLDNCLSVIKHETIYYPSRIRELARQALASADTRKENIASMHEYMKYYTTIFGILSNCAKRELDDNSFAVSTVPVEFFFEELSRYVSRRGKKLSFDIVLQYDPSSLSVNVDRDMVSYLFELLADAAMKVEKSGNLHLRAVDSNESVRVEFADSRRELSSEEAADLFVPTRRNLSADGGICNMEYLVAKEVIRLHEDRTGRRGSRIEARTDAGGTVILFTLPK